MKDFLRAFCDVVSTGFAIMAVGCFFAIGATFGLACINRLCEKPKSETPSKDT